MQSDRELEIEIKIQLESFTDYLKLMGFLGSIDEEEHHVNAFFDTPERTLGTNGFSLRVRSENQRGRITVKSAVSHTDAMSVRNEIEAEIDAGLAKSFVDGEGDPFEVDVEPIRRLRGQFGELTVSQLVRFRNSRQKKRFRLGDYEYVFEVDKTEFADGSVDYELEIELRDQGQYEVVIDNLRKIFQSLGIPFQRQPQTKLHRALERACLI